MKKKTTQSFKYAMCIDNSDYPESLEMHKVYRVLRDDEAQSHGLIRVIDESGEDYLFSAQTFVRVKLPVAAKKSMELMGAA